MKDAMARQMQATNKSMDDFMQEMRGGAILVHAIVRMKSRRTDSRFSTPLEGSRISDLNTSSGVVL